MYTQLSSASASSTLAASRNKVMRNTYWLLALSLLPTLVGALIGVQMNFGFMRASPIVSSLLMMVVLYGMMFAIEKNRYSSLGVGLMLGFTFLMGLLLGPLLQVALSLRNGGQLIAMAAGTTSLAFFVLAGIASTTKHDLSFLSKFITVGAVVLLAAMVANIFLKLPALYLALNVGFILFSSAVILYQIKEVVDGGEDSYISVTLTLYVSLYNIFSSLLQLLMAFGGDRD